MRVPEFDESLRTGQPLIDEQHEWLFTLAARVALMLGAEGRDDTGHMLRTPRVLNAAAEAVYGLLDYATEHFADEEQLMRESRYALAGVHASLHAELNRHLSSFVAVEVNGEPLDADEVVEFFVGWLTKHILEHDREFTVWLAAHPPAAPTG